MKIQIPLSRKLTTVLKKVKLSRLGALITVEVGVLLFLLGVVGYQSWSKPAAQYDLKASVLARQIYNECQGSDISIESCYSKKFMQITLKVGPEAAFKILDELILLDIGAQGCHFISHGIGQGAFLRNPQDWQNTVRTISQSCTYGAIHGVLESYVNTLPSGTLTKDLVPELCGSDPRADCNHIVGHLILVFTKGNISQALEMCDVFQDKTQHKFCLTGVFMEVQTAENLIAHGLAPKSWQDWVGRLGELEEMCRSYEGIYGESCWEELAHAIVAKFGVEIEEVFSFCDRSPLDIGAQRCRRHSLGIVAALHNFELKKLKSSCKIPGRNDPSFEEDCYMYLAASAIATSANLASATMDFCSSLESKFLDSCFLVIKTNLEGHGKSRQEIERLCSRLSKELLESCLGKGETNLNLEVHRSD